MSRPRLRQAGARPWDYCPPISLQPRWLIVPLIGLLLMLSGCAPTGQRSAIAAAPSATSDPTVVPRAELRRRQERLGVVARAIQDLVDPLEGPVAKPLPSGENRFGEVRIDSQRNVVELWWAGPLPREVRAVLVAHPHITTELHLAKYSNNELQSAGNTVAQYLRSGRLGDDDLTTDAIQRNVPAGRLTVHVIDPKNRWTVAQLHQRLDPLSDVPLDIAHQRHSTIIPL